MNEGEGAIENVAVADDVPTNTVVTERKGSDPIVATKTAEPAPGTVVSAGETITYKVTLTNTSDKAVKGIGFYDEIPEGTTYVAGSAKASMAGEDVTANVIEEANAISELVLNLDAHQSCEISFAVTVDEGVTAPVTNKATWASGIDEVPAFALEHETNEVTHITHVPAPAISVTKSADKVAGVVAGDEITYTIAVTNAGDAEGTTSVADAIPAGTTYVEGSATEGARLERRFAILGRVRSVSWSDVTVAGGETKTLSFKVRVNEGENAIRNVARWTKDDTDVPTNEVVTERKGPDPIVATKTAEPAPGTIVSVGDTITYKVSVTNVGDEDVEGVALYDAIPEGTEYVEGSARAHVDDEDVTANFIKDAQAISELVAYVEPGETCDVTFQVRVVEGAPETVTNKASWAAGATEVPVSALENETNEVTHVTRVPAPDISVTKSADKVAGVVAGDEITYTITAVNNGDADGTVSIADVIPAGTAYVEGSASEGCIVSRTLWVLGEVTSLQWNDVKVAAGAGVTVSFKVRVLEGDEAIENVATYDGIPTDTVVTERKGPDPIVMTKSADPASGSVVKAGDTITYKLHVTNTSDEVVNHIGILDVIPEGTTYVENSARGYLNGRDVTVNYIEETNALGEVIDSLGAGETCDITFEVTVNEDAPVTVTNSATWQSDVDGVPATPLENETNEVIHITHVPAPAIGVTKSVDKVAGVVAGDELT